MRIAVDACCWSNRRGFGRFTRELVEAMVAEFDEHEFVLVVDRLTAAQGRFPAGARLEVVETAEQPTQAASADGSRSVRDLVKIAWAARRVRPDALFFPAVYSFFPVLGRIPTVVTLHDATAENHPSLVFSSRRARWFWRWKTWLATRQADRLATVSTAARAQIAATFRWPESRIAVISEGPSRDFGPLDDWEKIRPVLERYRLPADAPLVLYVGGISPHKNLDGLLRAMAIVAARSAGPWHLVLVGDHQHDRFLGCYREVSRLAADLGLAERTTFTGFVPNDDLNVLYNAATMLAFPSFNEGFGLPAVEAMACGLPVAASRRGSLPEVVGSAGLLFDPEDPEDMAASICRLLGDAALREALRAQGRRRAAEFSWNAAARAAVALLEEAAHGPRRS